MSHTIKYWFGWECPVTDQAMTPCYACIIILNIKNLQNRK